MHPGLIENLTKVSAVTVGQTGAVSAINAE